VLLLRPRRLSGGTEDAEAEYEPITNVVVPLDLSENSESVMESARGLADAMDARLRLVTATAGVYMEPPSWGAWRGHFYTGGQLRSEAREYLDKFVNEAADAGIDAESIAVSGDPEREIIRVARETPGSMVVMASSGLSRFRRWMIGSVTDKVVRGAECPVLVLPYVASPPTVETEADVIRVGEVMTSPAITVTGDATLEQAARLMVDNNIGSLPVIDDEDIIIGMITESLFVPAMRHLPFSRDPIYTVFDKPIGGVEDIPDALHSLRNRPIREIMTVGRASITEDAPLVEAVRLMMRDSVSHLPVHLAGKIVGVVALHDMLYLVANTNGDLPGPAQGS
jgi:nucleotide-binding universal stress UspA family protein/predicted transcriptional regulator